MRHAMIAVGGLLVAFGTMALVIALANLYNIDYQPRRTLALIAGVGVVSVVVGVVLLRRNLRSADTPAA
jgi:hypothetical protein